MIDYAHLKTLPSLARIQKNPRQWDFFCWLLNQADEDGYALVSVREFAAMTKIPNSTIHDWLKSDNFRTIIETTKMNKLTLVFFCNYASYVSETAQKPHKNRTISAQFPHNNRTIVRNLKESESSPHTPFKGKEKNVNGHGATLQEEEEEAAGANSSTQFVRVEVPQLPRRTHQQLEDARGRFWQLCLQYARQNPSWPMEGVKSFFLFWTEYNQKQDKFKFEMEETWGTPHRMLRYLKQGKWLQEVRDAKIEKIKNGGGRMGASVKKGNTPTTAEIKQKELALRIEQEEHDRRAQAAITMMQNAKSHEDAKSDYRYWEGLGLDNPATLAMAQEKPEWLAAYNLAVQKRDEKKAQ